MQEFSVAQINAHVGGFVSTGELAVKEDEVSGLQLGLADRNTVFQLGGRVAVDGIAKMLVYVLRQTGAVKRVGAGSSVYILLA